MVFAQHYLSKMNDGLLLKGGEWMMHTGLKMFFGILFMGLVACGYANRLIQITAGQAQRPVAALAPQYATATGLLDSAAVERFILQRNIADERAGQLRSFYRRRAYQLAWFDKNGLAQPAKAFWAMQLRHLQLSGDSSGFNKNLHQQMQLLLQEDKAAPVTSLVQQSVDLELTNSFFAYAQVAYAGKIDPGKLQWHIPRKEVHPVALLDSLIEWNGKNLEAWEPVNEAYKRLRNGLSRLYQIRQQGGWSYIPPSKKAYRQGDSAAAIVLLKKRLWLSGDYASTDSTPIFTPALEWAVQSAQRRLGLQPDGMAGTNTLQELNVPVEERIRQVQLNLERMRWMPKNRDSLHLVVNIPAFRLYVMDGPREVMEMKIVVGKAAHQTVVFTNSLQYIVFSPYWNVPASIVRNEILPALRRNPSYLLENNMEQTGERNGLPIIRQRPGAENALGRVKFIFPNEYNIYFHDTPAKSLFNQSNRAASHGCIRLEDPGALARLLLQNSAEWTDSKIFDAMYSGEEKWVKLKSPVPVEIIYFTAWMDDGGRLNFRKDIYGHDKELASQLLE